MSHFLTLVIGENPEKQLDKFDDNLVMPMHLYKTKEQLIADKRKEIEEYKRDYYDVFLADPELYRSKYLKVHVDYVEKEFPKQLSLTDEQLYKDATKRYRESVCFGKDIELREDGSVWATYNDEGKWDWYVMGGRFAGQLQLKDKTQEAPLYNPEYSTLFSKKHYQLLKKDGRCDQALVGDISNLDEITCFAVVMDSKWYERGKAGWFGVVIDAKDEEVWAKEVKQLLTTLSPDTLLTMYDCHI